MILGLKIALGGHLDGRLDGHNKTKCVDWVDIRVDTFYMVLTTFTPPNNDEKKRIDHDFCRLPPPFIPHWRGYDTASCTKYFFGNALFIGLFGYICGVKPIKSARGAQGGLYG